MTRLFCLVSFLFCFLTVSGFAQNASPYAGEDPEDLIQRSIKMASLLERTEIRIYVAETYPETAEGYFARAWIADKNGEDMETIIGLYKKATELRPDFNDAWFNLGTKYHALKRFQEAEEAYSHCLAIQPVDPWAIRNLYFTIGSDLDEPQRADAFLKNAERNGISLPYVYDFVRGIEARSAGNKSEAEQLFARAISHGGRVDFQAYEALADLRLDRLDRTGGSEDEKFQVLREVIEYARTNRSAKAMNYVAEQLNKRYKAYRQAMDMYEMSYKLEPTPEAAIEGFAVLANYDFDRSYAFLERAERDFPNIWEIKTQLAWANYSFLHQPDIAENYGREAVRLAALPSAVEEAVRSFGEFYETEGRFDEALGLYLDMRDGMPESQMRNLTSYAVLNRIYAQDYDRASRYLDEMEKMPNTSGSWISQRRERIATAAAMENERKTFLTANPFLKNWEETIGSSLTLAIEFETNSDVIRERSFSELDKAARILNAPGGDKYVFLIEGHTDSRGSDEINQPLSARRAEAAATYLKENHGIPAKRLRTVGYGPRHPVDTNDTEAGRQHNRRVEIRPYGNVSDPEIAVTSALNADGTVISPNGRLAAVGLEPVQIWDLNQRVKIRDLYRGSMNQAFSPNGRYLATTSSYREVLGGTTHVLYIYDTKTGHAVSQVHAEIEFAGFDWSPYSDEIVYTDDRGFVKVYNLAQRRIRSVGRLGTRRISGPIVWLADGRTIAAGQAQRQGVRVFDAQTLKMDRNLSGVEWAHRMGQSHDGRFLVVVDNRRVMAIWDTGTWQLVTQIQSPVIPQRIVSHPSKPWILMNDTFNSKVGLALVDLSKGNILASREAPQDLGITFSPDGNTFAAGAGESVSWYDTHTLNPISEMTGLSPRGKGLTLNEKDGYITSLDSSGAYVWDLATGQRIQSLRTSTTVGWRRKTKDGSTQYTISPDNDLVQFNSDDFREEVVTHFDFEVIDLRQGEEYIVVLGRKGAGGSRSTEAVMRVLDRETLSEISRAEFSFATAPLQYGEIHGSFFSGLSINSKESLIAVTTAWMDGYGHDYTYSRVVRIFDAKTGREVNAISNRNALNGLRFDDDESTRIEMLEVGGGWQGYDARSGKYLGWEPALAVWEHELDDGRVIEWSRDILRLGDRSIFFHGTLRSIAVDESRNLLVALTNSNELVYFDVRTLERQLTVLVKSDGEWIAYAPSGEFTSSLNGTNGVFWSLGDNYLPFEALRQKFEQPRIIQERLSRLQNETEDRPVNPEPEKADVDPELFEVPYKVMLDSPASEAVDSDSYILRLRVEKASADLPEPEFEYSLNGRTVLKSRGFDEEPVYDGGEVIGVARKFSLREGQNTIEASLVYKDARVLTQKVEITRRAEKKQLRNTTQLWFFGVGISEYEINTQNLQYAHKDALELEKAFKAQEGVLYGKVNTKVLVNELATEREIRVEMNDFLRQASAEDVIVLFVAGHGIQDNDQRLYLVTHDGDIERPYTGMQIDKFKDYLSSRPINQKAIFLMDICHAGATGPKRRGRITSEEAVKALTRGTGTIVFASSTGAQSSLEDESFGGGHGAFTAALLEGLAGGADKNAGDGDGFNSITELISYTSRRVPQLTNGDQHPTMPQSDNVLDFPLTAAH